METLTKKVSRIYCKLWPSKSKCLFKDFDLWRSGNGFLVRNAFIKIHDEFENVTIEYLSVQGGIYSTTCFYEQSWLIEAINKFIMEKLQGYLTEVLIN
jgi:hypothetical protein